MLIRTLVVCLTVGVIAWVDATQSAAVSPASVAQGRILFERNWPARNPQFGGDGLGPLFNGQSCVACHNQGGVGGGGEAEFNANTIGIENLRISGPGIDDDVIAKMVGLFHPGFVQIDGSVINTFTIPHRGGSAPFRGLSEGVLRNVPTERSDFGGSADAAEVRHSYATPILFSQKSGAHQIVLRARLFQRNTTSLFGAGLIDAVSDKEIAAQAKAQKQHPEISGRPSTLKNGRIGRFGWRGNVSSLVEFVDQACANEVGLETRRKPQARDPLNRGYRNSTIDISDEQIESMNDFIAALPRPIRLIPESSEDRAEVARGEQAFAAVGCAVCHVPDLGPAKGLYSDLLLHEMGMELIDLNHAEPYVIRRTPIMRHDYTQATATETSPGSMGAYYGATTTIQTTDPGRISSAATGSRRRPARNVRPGQYTFVAPDYPSRLINIINLDSSTQTGGSGERTLEDGRKQVTEATLTRELYVRIHYERTAFNQEWRTPPLWGVRDSAPYMHDGRAETLLEAITMHDGESAGTRDRFLNLSLADRHAVIEFLRTLVAPPGAPQSQN